MAAAAKDAQTLVGRVLKDFDQDSRPHKAFIANVDRWYRAYRGIIEQRSRAAEWTSKQHPAYAFQVIETLTANVVDPQPRWPVKAYPRMADAATIQMLTEGAEANELLLMQQTKNPRDPFALKQSAFAKQAFIAGMSVYKTSWDFAERPVTRQTIVNEQIDDLGTTFPRIRRVKNTEAVRDDPCVEVVDVRDWFPHEGATSLSRAMRVTHRVWYSLDELRRLEASGVYGVKAGGQPVDGLKDSRDFQAGSSSREQDLFQSDRSKDQIEVLEQWRREPDGSLRVVSVGNRSVLLRDTGSPFDHDEFPFVVCAPIPDLLRIGGISVVEQIAELQEAAWTFLNQRLDMTELLASPPILIADDYDGPDFVWGPGEQNVVQRPDQVAIMNINPALAEVSLKAEEMLKQDLQNIPGASPTLLGQVDPSAQTATEVSLTTSLAQRRVALMKQQFKWANKQVGEQWLSLNQQFLSGSRLVERLGPDGAAAWDTIHPLLLQGDYYIELDSLDESLMRQERRAEAQAKLQVALNAAQFFAASPGQPPLNLRRFMDDYLDAFDISDTAGYYSAAPSAPAQMGGPPQSAGPDGPQQGLTAPQAYDATSPSNATSLSPMAATQRMGAMAGGPVNAG
jgi:hypothetical protein